MMDGTIFRTFIGVLAASAAFLLHASPIESADVVVIGGSEAGVSAALAARKAGARTVLLESRPGDRGGLARRSLEAFARDPRRAYAEHARMVLGKQ